MTRSKKDIFSLILILLIIGSLGIFLKLSQEVLTERIVARADIRIATWIYTLRQPFTTSVMLFFTSLGNTSTVIIAIGIATVVFFIWHKRAYALLLLGSSFGSYLFVLLAKLIAHRARPGTMHALVVESSFSFPSGHALIAIAFYGLLAYFFILIVKPVWARIGIVILGIIIILGVGFSRIYLGVHWPSDVLASYIIGIGWLGFLILCLEHKDGIKSFLVARFPKLML